MRQVLPNAELICLGTYMPDFRLERPRWEGKFTHYEWLLHPELSKVLRTATAFVLPSVEEGFAKAAVEAMASGLPLIATHESGATTFVRDGVEGLIVKARQIEQLADAMIKLGSNRELSETMGKAAYARGAKNNSWDDYAERLIKIFAEALARRERFNAINGRDQSAGNRGPLPVLQASPELVSILKHLVPASVQRPYRDLQKRLDRLELSVRSLEMAIDALVISPKYVPAEEIGFNGQRGRKRIFADLISAVSFDAIAETGTWLGNTTAFMAQTARRPVYSCELNPRFHALAKMRLAGTENVHLVLSDTRQFLKSLIGGPLAGQAVFFYLDAHWYEDLPLVEEVELIASHWKSFVVMIDDFEVPGDPGYGFDDYGAGNRLDIELLSGSVRNHSLSACFPAMPSSEESGTRRGCVVLSPPGELAGKLSKLPSLKQWRAGA